MELIDKQATIDWLKKVTVTEGITFETGFEQIIYDIEQMPSVTPTRPTGHWIAGVDRWGDIVTTVNGYRCSECCAFNADKDNYCPNCGAKMEGMEE